MDVPNLLDTPTDLARPVESLGSTRRRTRGASPVPTVPEPGDRGDSGWATAVATAGPPDEATKAQIYRRALGGVSRDVLADETGLTRARIARIINEGRARRLLDAKLEFMPHPSFDDPSQHAAILGPIPGSIESAGPARGEIPEGLPPYLADLYEAPLLNREQEAHLFRKMNFLKSRAAATRERIDPARARAADLDELERLQGEALAVKNQIIRANLRLVVSIAKRHVGPADNLFELVSDGNVSLIRAVEKFDYSRGNKFSTYASWAIMRNFSRGLRDESRRRGRFVTGHDEAFESAADTRAEDREQEAERVRDGEGVRGMLSVLDDRERRIIASRYGLGGSAQQTLEQIGRELGITKERVRQIESRAREKLRKVAVSENFDVSAN